VGAKVAALFGRSVKSRVKHLAQPRGISVSPATFLPQPQFNQGTEKTQPAGDVNGTSYGSFPTFETAAVARLAPAAAKIGILHAMLIMAFRPPAVKWP